MDVQITTDSSAPKRLIVDANDPNIEIPTAKKPQVPQEIVKKGKIILFIAHAHHKIALTMLGEGYDQNDLSLGDQIHNVLFTSYTILRQRHNQTGGTLESRIASTDFKVTYNNSEKTKPRDIILKIVENEALERGIPFGKFDQKDKDNWYGIANPLLNFLSGFSLRRKELRLGHHTMPIDKRNNVQRDVTLSQYGIYGVHHPLCEGVTFPPEKRASMPQSVGPLTALLCYIKADRRYSKKWEIAAKRAFAHFPEIDVILQLIKEKDPSEIRTLISLVADVALIVTTRQATRMFPPPAVFSFVFRFDHKVDNVNYPLANVINNFNFSGHGAFVFYKIFSGHSWKLNLNGGTDSFAKQIVYHCMFGTYKEDLGILSAITNQGRWDTREKMGKIFQKSNTEGTPVVFKPIQQIFYSKLSQANQTGLLTSSYSQLSSIPCFSGRTKRKFDDAFFDHLTNGNRISGNRIDDVLVN